jgi:phage-related holin
MKHPFLQEPLLFSKGAIVFLIGPLDHQLSYLLIAMLVDLIFGIQVALREKKFSITILLHKFGVKLVTYGLWIVMFHAFDRIAGLPDTGRWSLILVLAGLEIVSAIKNTSKLGHSALAEALEKLYLTLSKKGGPADEKSKPRKRGSKKAASETTDSSSDTL